MRMQGFGFVFRMALGGDEKRMHFLGQFYHFHEKVVGGSAGNNQAVIFQNFAIVVIEFVSVPVPFGNFDSALGLDFGVFLLDLGKQSAFAGFEVNSAGLGIFQEITVVSAQTHGSALAFYHLVSGVHGNVVDNRIFGFRIYFHAVGVGQTDHVAGKFHAGQLHAVAQAQIRNFLFPGVSDGRNFAFGAAVAPADGHNQPVGLADQLAALFFYVFSINKAQIKIK